MRRRNYLAGTALGAVTSATALLGGCLDSLETDGPGSGDEDDTDTGDTGTSDVDDSADDEEDGPSEDDGTDSTDGEDQDAGDSEQDDEDDSEQDGDESQDQDDEDDSAQDGDESQDQDDEENSEQDGDESRDDEDEQQEDDERAEDEGDESRVTGTVEFEVIDMTPSMESGTEFTYIVLAHTDGSESIPGEASLVDETGATVDSTSYEATSGGGSFELTYRAPTVDEETEVALAIETDHGPVNLGSVRVFPSETTENDDSSGSSENSTENDGSSSPTENSTESGDSNSPTENSTEGDD